MKNLFLALLLQSIVMSVALAQDVDVYKRDLNDHFAFPPIPKEMNFDDFKILSTNIRLMDAMDAMVVPGYIHFKAMDKTTGYTLIGIRSLGFIGLVYVNYKSSTSWKDILNYKSAISSEAKTSYYIALGSIAMITSSYLYDWIHGRAILESKQQNIRYKYSLKLNVEQTAKTGLNSSYVPMVSVAISY